MNMFELSEEKALLFHRALIGLADLHPDLIDRAVNQLDTFRMLDPDQTALWDRWAVLLALPISKMALHVLADDPDAGLLRANSPIGKALSATERNAVWQRIGLMQFVDHFLAAANDLGLSLSELATVTGVIETEIQEWHASGPQQVSPDTLRCLKQIVSLHTALSGLEGNQDARRRWLRRDSEALGDRPISLLLDGKADQLLDSVSGAVQLTLGDKDLPRMGR